VRRSYPGALFLRIADNALPHAIEDLMREGQVSRTAEYMALFRALETTVPARARLFQDRYAAAFLSRHLRFVVTLAKIPFVGALIRALIDRRWPGPRTSAVARTRFIDDAAAAALDAGIDQVVILGAGFDARAYRLAAMARAVVFEVDHPSTSAAKRAAIENKIATAPTHVRFVPIDFNVERLGGVMQAAGYDARRRTLFIWEGVTNYLTEEAVDATLRWCAASAAGGRVLFTYVHKQVLIDPQAFEGARALQAALHAAGEHWTFGLDPAALPSFLAARGLQLVEDVGAADYRARYYRRAAERMRGYEFYRIAVAHVLDHGARGPEYGARK
jgi:methyltransferase (TIGR00027 family)